MCLVKSRSFYPLHNMKDQLGSLTPRGYSLSALPTTINGIQTIFIGISLMCLTFLSCSNRSDKNISPMIIIGDAPSTMINEDRKSASIGRIIAGEKTRAAYISDGNEISISAHGVTEKLIGFGIYSAFTTKQTEPKL